MGNDRYRNFVDSFDCFRLQDLPGRAFRHLAALFQQHDAVGVLGREIQVVQNHEHPHLPPGKRPRHRQRVVLMGEVEAVLAKG